METTVEIKGGLIRIKGSCTYLIVGGKDEALELVHKLVDAVGALEAAEIISNEVKRGDENVSKRGS